ncbi:hypothetical protein [Rhizobium tibeticum]|uniref:hypothetical protein n=1 Tax=Rhizobium tibeticum TaxID=501024 RepID=UPI0027D7B142|nr:hypothetical protein [Rhizobium tibeticum]
MALATWSSSFASCIAVQLADSLTLTPGTDFTAEVSRDGGTTWTAVTLSLTMPQLAGVKMFEGQFR